MDINLNKVSASRKTTELKIPGSGASRLARSMDAGSRLSPEKIITICVALTYVLLIGVAVSNIGRALNLVKDEESVKRHERAAQLITYLQVTIHAAELEQYKYSLTGNSRHLRRCGTLLDNLKQPLKDLKGVLGDSRDQKERLAIVEKEIDRTVRNRYYVALREKRKQGSAAAGQVLLRKLTGSRDALSPTLAEMRRVELTRLGKESSEFKEELGRSDAAIMTLLVLVLLTILLYMTRRYIQERLRSEQAIKASERRVRTVIDNMLDALIIIDEDGVIESMNPRTVEMFGFDPDELAGRHIAELFPPSANVDPAGFMNDVRSNALTRVKEFKAQKRNQVEFPIEIAVREFYTREEGFRYLVTIRDVTEKHDVERLKRQFVSTVSHELRTPLTSMSLSLGLFSAGAFGELPPRVMDTIAILERNTTRLIALINDLLDLTRLESGQLSMEFSNVKLSSVVERTLDSVRAVAEEHKVRIDTPATDTTVFGDADRLVQVLVNLVSNAVKFSPADGVVRVSIAQNQGWVAVSVSDQGRGIPPKAKEAIFEPFYQVDKSDSKKRKGTGLGLAICKTIIQRHGGTIGVDSEEGKGSTFWFWVPAASNLGVPPPVAVQQTQTG